MDCGSDLFDGSNEIEKPCMDEKTFLARFREVLAKTVRECHFGDSSFTPRAGAIEEQSEEILRIRALDVPAKLWEIDKMRKRIQLSPIAGSSVKAIQEIHRLKREVPAWSSNPGVNVRDITTGTTRRISIYTFSLAISHQYYYTSGFPDSTTLTPQNHLCVQLVIYNTGCSIGPPHNVFFDYDDERAAAGPDFYEKIQHFFLDKIVSDYPMLIAKETQVSEKKPQFYETTVNKSHTDSLLLDDIDEFLILVMSKSICAELPPPSTQNIKKAAPQFGRKM